jgi:hypothetical protein
MTNNVYYRWSRPLKLNLIKIVHLSELLWVIQMTCAFLWSLDLCHWNKNAHNICDHIKVLCRQSKLALYWHLCFLLHLQCTSLTTVQEMTRSSSGLMHTPLVQDHAYIISYTETILQSFLLTKLHTYPNRWLLVYLVESFVQSSKNRDKCWPHCLICPFSWGKYIAHVMLKASTCHCIWVIRRHF